MFYLAHHRSLSCFWFCLFDIYTFIKRETYCKRHINGKIQMLHILIVMSKLKLKWNSLVLNVTQTFFFFKSTGMDQLKFWLQLKFCAYYTFLLETFFTLGFYDKLHKIQLLNVLKHLLEVLIAFEFFSWPDDSDNNQ